MSGKWISIGRPPCGRAFAASVASWATAMARTMDSPRPWWSSTRAVESLEGLEEEVDLLGRGVRDPGHQSGGAGNRPRGFSREVGLVRLLPAA
jgi:hypothetical protein